jgi:hypothetical protein
MDKQYDNNAERKYNRLSLTKLLELSKNLDDKNTLLFSELIIRVNQYLFPDTSINETWFKDFETLSKDIVPKLTEKFKDDLANSNAEFAELEINCFDDYFRIDILIDKQNPEDSSISLSHSSETYGPNIKAVYNRFEYLQNN